MHSAHPRRRAGWCALALVAALVAASCGAPPPATKKPSPPATMPARIAVSSLRTGDPVLSQDETALDLYRALISTGQAGAGDNLVFSPVSITQALGMLLAGARGETAAQIEAALHLDLAQAEAFQRLGAMSTGLMADARKAGNVTLDLGNAAWGQAGFPFLPAYLTTLRTVLGAPLHTEDFERAPDAATKAINAWVSQVTRGHIPNLVGPGVIDTLTRLVLTNAVYLDAKWRTDFPLHATKEAPFTTAAGHVVRVKMMHGELGGEADPDANALYGAGNGFDAVELPYGTNGSDVHDLVMDVILPAAGTLPAFVRGLDGVRLGAILRSLQGADLTLAMPRFSFATSANLGPVLEALGVRDAFDPGSADLSGIDGGKDLSVGAALHKATITTDETGTVASAATGIFVEEAAGPPPPPRHSLTLDHPFLFLVRDPASGAILFLGQVTDPAAGA